MESKSYGRICAFFNCNNTDGTVPKKSFHTLPNPNKDRTRYKKWVAAVALKRKWTPPLKSAYGTSKWRSVVVCSDHFERACFNGNGSLKKDSIPTIYWRPPSSEPVQRKTRTSLRTSLLPVSLLFIIHFLSLVPSYFYQLYW